MFRRLAVRLRTLAPPRSASKIAQFSVGSSTPSENVVRSLPVFSRHFSSESGNVPKKVEDIVPIATGHEREELEAELEGRDILEINHPSGPFGTKVEVEFDNGSAYNLSAEYLRVYSPAVDSKIRSVGGEKVIAGRRDVGIMSAEPVGNYGVRLLFDDLHKTGIFTWDYFYYLGSNKLSLMRNYIGTLKKHGLSRDPRIRK
ncbi:uncharacterized protein LOC130992340 isoform X3 [Salvia miltiorrhiza]|uniref:uncharacterized protein LOC130992340 isoform X3 n=1 Tax=Salvia miltiorrhiza TaxID=226208 RepID=UPI0025ABF979|nr:uncharacterized protein LOC130992340 isoform X3 [Salvia miltiorrhiza]